MGVEVANNISERTHIRFNPQNLCIRLGRVSTKVVKRIVKFVIILNFGENFCSIFSAV